jgi:tetratricopeptide (TPR) repeat protein
LARWHFNQNPGLGSEQAFSAINEALRLDPAFISAYILQFEMYVWRFRASPSEVATKTEQIAQKVLALDPSSGPAHAARAWSKHCTFQWNDAISELKTAIALAPDYPMAHVLYGLILTKLGRFAEARPQFAAALQLDPTSRMIAVVAGFPDYYSNSYTNAIVQFRNALELEPNSVYAYDFIVGAYERMGNYPAALTTVKDRRLRNGEDPAKVDSDLQRRLQAFRQFGPRGYWEDLYQDEFASGPNPNLQRLALVYVHLDEKQKALDCLERAFDTTTYTALWLKVDSAWDPIRAEPRFQSLLRRARFPE